MAATPSRGREWARRHRAALLAMLVVVVTGMAFSLLWNRVFYHSSNWITPGDLWSTYRAAQYVTWGGLGQIYNNPAAFQTFPGIAVILSPVAKLAGALNLSEGFPVAVAQPTAWLLLGPVQLALGATLLLPLEQLARRLNVAPRRRLMLLALEAALIWPSVAIWGHPEDALSLTLAVYALLAVADGAWTRVGIYFGLAIVIQPLVVLLVPLTLALVPVRRWPILTVEMLVPSVVLFLPPLVQEWGPTTRILLKQPNFVGPNHPTPWVSLAPVITPAQVKMVPVLKHLKLHGGLHRATEVMVKVHTQPVVAAGPGRIVAVLAACLIGVYIKVRKPSWPKIIWWAALVLSLRCVFEPVMVPYYLLPGLALALVVASRDRLLRFYVVAFAAAVDTWLSYFHVSPWDYYAAMTLPLLVVLAVAYPRSDAAGPLLSRDAERATSFA
ncbi:MAG: hypothetical protein PXZ08_09540 [Actinomycetota bacterium]|nr:hypothetical protein [Actinomycetota bacterium]